MYGGGGSEAEGDDRLVNWTMSKLALSSISLKGTKLPVRPPVLTVGKGRKEEGRIGREGADGVIRRNY